MIGTASISVLGLRLDPVDGATVALMPTLDRTPLAEVVGTYEARHSYEPAGGYAGIIPAHSDFGDLRAHYLGRSEKERPRAGHAWLLGCDCGEVGCWPLTARITVNEVVVTWSGFTQDHRPAWDYRSLGPFYFHRSQYEDAVDEALLALEGAPS